MLTGAGLCDDALLSHSAREERLAECVVDFMCTRVKQVFPLQINLGAATMLGEPLREIQLSRSSRELLQVVAELRQVDGILLRLVIRSAKFFERRHQRLGHEYTAVLTEPARGIWQRKTVE